MKSPIKGRSSKGKVGRETGGETEKKIPKNEVWCIKKLHLSTFHDLTAKFIHETKWVWEVFN